MLMRELSLQKAISRDQLFGSLGRRFTVTLRDEFRAVTVDGQRITTNNGLPDFEFRIPAAGFITESVDGREVRAWVGFKNADWSADRAGVGVYAHGKIAQIDPSFQR
ncbi:MAG: hypothetical protein R3F39_23440 [Myxococcota bacterium]